MDKRETKSQRKNEYIDVGLVFATFVLIIIGLIMIYSTSAYEANIVMGDSFYYLTHQLIAVAVGVAALIFTSRFNYNYYRGLGKWALLVAGGFFVLLLTPLAYSANGATRWIKIGPLSIQPAEIAKIAIIIYLAGIIVTKLREIATLKGTALSLIYPVIFAGVIFLGTSNLSSAIIVMGISVVMLYTVTPNIKRYLVFFAVVALIATVYVLVI